MGFSSSCRFAIVRSRRSFANGTGGRAEVGLSSSHVEAPLLEGGELSVDVEQVGSAAVPPAVCLLIWRRSKHGNPAELVVPSEVTASKVPVKRRCVGSEVIRLIVARPLTIARRCRGERLGAAVCFDATLLCIGCRAGPSPSISAANCRRCKLAQIPAQATQASANLSKFRAACTSR